MKCDHCHNNNDTAQGEEWEYLENALCGGCYMDALSPARTCDPGAVHSAKSFEQPANGPTSLTGIQKKILQIFQETGRIDTSELLERLKEDLTPSQLEREFAGLRHMEKVRGEWEGRAILSSGSPTW